LSDLRVKILKDPDEVPASEWDTLRARPPASLNLSREWAAAALATTDADADPRLLAVHRGDRLLGLLPLALRGMRGKPTLGFLGAPHNDLTDLMALPGEEEAAARAILQFLGSWEPGMAIDLEDLDPLGVLATYDRDHRALEWSPSTGAPKIDLRRPWTSVASPRLAGRIRNAMERLRAAHSVELGWVRGTDAVAALPAFISCREARLTAKGRPLDLPPLPLLENVVRRLAPVGRCALVELRIEGELAAADLYLLDPPVGMMWLRALERKWQKHLSGHLLLHATMKLLGQEGYEVLDLGRGDEPYKFDFGAEARLLLRATRP
jgi:CelD/BcsL family acetyltransferase involved in cellulose biosynthesis